MSFVPENKVVDQDKNLTTGIFNGKMLIVN